MDPWADAAGLGTSHPVHDRLQSGGMTGQGLGESHAKHMFLRSPGRILSPLSWRRLGLIGVFFLLGLYAVVVLRGMSVPGERPFLWDACGLSGDSSHCRSGPSEPGGGDGSLAAKGLVLPFMSYGGSAIMVHLMCIGLLLNISANGRAESKNAVSLSSCSVSEAVA